MVYLHTEYQVIRVPPEQLWIHGNMVAMHTQDLFWWKLYSNYTTEILENV